MRVTFQDEATSVREIERLWMFVNNRETEPGYLVLVPSLIGLNMRLMFPEQARSLDVASHILSDATAALEVASLIGAVSVYRLRESDYRDDPELASMGAKWIASIGNPEQGVEWMPADTMARAIVLAIIQVFRRLGGFAASAPEDRRTLN